MKQDELELDLPRLSEAGDPALSRAISGLRAHQPDVTELASLASQLAVRGIPLTSPKAQPNVASAAWKKWALAGGGAVSGVVLWWALREPAPVASTVPPEAPSELSPRAVGVTVPSPVVVPGRGRVAVGAASAVPEAPPGAATPEVTSPTPVDTPAPPGARSTPAAKEQDTARAVPTTRAPAGIANGRTLVPDVSGAVAAPTEIELLRDARLALKSSPVRALELAESHARSYPSGKLTQERELIAISALVSLGRRTAALSRASRFEQSFPQSPYRKQIGDLLQ